MQTGFGYKKPHLILRNYKRHLIIFPLFTMPHEKIFLRRKSKQVIPLIYQEPSQQIIFSIQLGVLSCLWKSIKGQKINMMLFFYLVLFLCLSFCWAFAKFSIVFFFTLYNWYRDHFQSNRWKDSCGRHCQIRQLDGRCQSNWREGDVKKFSFKFFPAVVRIIPYLTNSLFNDKMACHLMWLGPVEEFLSNFFDVGLYTWPISVGVIYIQVTLVFPAHW